MASSKRRKLSGPDDNVLLEKVLKKVKQPKQESPDVGPQPVSEEEPAQEDAPSTIEGAQGPKTFRELGLIDSLCDACDSLGYKEPTPIQKEAIPAALEGRDVIGLAETGSGKTAAFALPILEALMKKPQSHFGLVLAPTRELAFQISQAFEALGSLISVRCAVLVGGMDMVSQAIALGKKPHIIVATPGRLLDHLENTKGFSLIKLQYLVFDEADKLLDMDFGPSIDKILKVLPKERRTFFFSATMTSKVESLQRASLNNPVKISISTSKYQTVSRLVQDFIFLPFKDKDKYLVWLLNEHIGQSVICFTRTVNETQRLAFLLRSLGFGAIPLHGQLSQSNRLGALGKFRSKSRDILVATDVAARGLDVPNVDMVLNYDLPSDSKTFIHRIGRTARASKSGKATSFVTQYDIEVWQRIEHALGKQIDKFDPDQEEIDIFGERVSEAQKNATKEMKIFREKGKGSGTRGRHGKSSGKRGRDDMDREEG